MGEPLLHPNIKDIFSLCNEKNLNVYLTTNGTLLKQNLDLLKTGGTDYHGEIKPNVKLGTGINNNVHVTNSTMVDYLSNLNKQKVKCIKKNRSRI